MSSTLILWFLVLIFCIFKGLSRPAWMLAGYLQTVFAAPQYWWWGKEVPTVAQFSWSLWLAVFVIVSLLISGAPKHRIAATNAERICFVCLVLASLNVAWVQFSFADSPANSYIHADIFWKTSLLLFLFYKSIRNIDDLMLVLGSIFVGCASIGYQVVIGKQGYMEKGRLEGIAIPGASDSNLISGILLLGLLIGGYFTLTLPKLWKKGLAVFGSVLILETILRNNSRGCYLALIVAGGAFLLFSTGKARKYATIGGVLGFAGVLMLAKNEAIWNRFYSTFADAEERDLSAQSRVDFWKAAIDMINAYPLGSGGESAFISPRGMSFISHLSDYPRAVHNGYLDMTASWGVQGGLLFAIVSTLSIATVVITNRRSKQSDDVQLNLLCALLLSLALSQLVVGMFLSSLDCEVPLMSLAMCLVSWRIYSTKQTESLLEDSLEEEAFEDPDEFYEHPDQKSDVLDSLTLT